MGWEGSQHLGRSLERASLARGEGLSHSQAETQAQTEEKTPVHPKPGCFQHLARTNQTISACLRGNQAREWWHLPSGPECLRGKPGPKASFGLALALL